MIKKNILLLILFTLSCSLTFCQAPNTQEQKQPQTAIDSLPKPQIKDTQTRLDSVVNIQIKGHWVTILSPKTNSVKGNILVLPGWSFPRQDWCEKSSLCSKALARGYRLILPEMGKSVYATQLYPETRADWRSFPTNTWLMKEMIPYLQDSLKIMTRSQDNFALGLSTGARGVALVALADPTLWKAGAALSGDYDQALMPQDRLIAGFYGSYAQFKNRWESVDNPNRQAQNFKTALYLGHGVLDNISPPSQTQLFYNTLKKLHPNLRLKLNMQANAKHDYAYWDSEVENMLNFFEEK